jgi:predicted secreted protein
MHDYRKTARSMLAALAPAALLAASGCATLQRDEVAAPVKGGSVVMRIGTPLIVSLPPDPEAGYGWVLTSSSENLYLIGGPDYTPDPKPPGLVGVADTTAFRFRARSTGTATLEFAWRPPPGQVPAPRRTVVRYDVTIRPGFPEAIADWVYPPGGGEQPTVKY